MSEVAVYRLIFVEINTQRVIDLMNDNDNGKNGQSERLNQNVQV